MRLCPYCEIERQEIEFYANASTDCKLSTYCKRCVGKLANRPRGDREEFLKLTITLAPELYYALKKMSLNKRCEGKKDSGTSELIREAIGRFI